MRLLPVRTPTSSPAPAQDLTARLSSIRRCPSAPQETVAAGPGPRAEAAARLGACLEVIAQAAEEMRTAASHVIAAASEPDEASRALLAERYDDSRLRIDALCEDLPEATECLLGPQADPLAVPLRGATYAVAPFPLTTSETGLDLPPPEDGFTSHAEVAATLRRVELALERLGRVRAVYAADRDFLQAGA